MRDATPTTTLDVYAPQLVIDWLDAGGGAPEAQARVVDGSLVFADVSGFTPLSERLARKGRVGSEELTEILNQVFSHLLDVSSGYGGDLLKYGGDALLLLFVGARHAERAAVAAATMQHVLRDNSRIDTGAGIVRLRMSVGVHSGEIAFALVGESHRELLLGGPAVTITVEMESAADAGEVLVSAATAAQVDDRWLGDGKEGGRLLRLSRVDGALPLLPFTRHLTDAAVAAVPVGLRAHLARGVGEGEHRAATLAFLQYKGTDALLAETDPLTVARELHSLVFACQQACERYDVTFLATDIDADGGKVLFATGSPRVGVNDSDRMLLAMRTIVSHPTALRIRAGVNRGHAFAVDVGAAYRRTYAVMGDPTNLAARVMGKASPGGVLATAAVVADLRGEFELDEREPFMVKGKSHPITAFDVGEPIGARRAGSDENGPLVGREVERAHIDDAVRAARAGTGRTLAFVGGPGIGKSRLVAYLYERATEFQPIVFEGGQYAAHTPQFALRPALRRLLEATLANDPSDVARRLQTAIAARAPHLQVWLPLLNEAFGIDLPETPEVAAIETRFRRGRVADLLVDVLDVLVGGPAMVVIEDAHWLDDSSADILRELFAAATSRRWVVCVTSRDAAAMLMDTDASTATVHYLAPLSPEDSRELLYAYLGDSPLPPLTVAAIAERSGGNPLFLAELLAAARAGGGVEALPESLEAVIASRIDALDAEARSTLQSAAVLGVRFPVAALASMLDRDPDHIADELAALDSFVLVDNADTRRFRSALLRQVAYETLPFRRRRALHARAASILEAVAAAGGERPIALLSLHYMAAEDHHPAWVYAREAGDLAAASHAAVEATALYGRAIDAARRLRSVAPEELAAVYLALGEQSEFAGRSEDATNAFAKARALRRNDPVALAEVMLKDGWLRERSRHYAQALRWYSKALSALADAPSSPSADQRRARLHAEILVAYGAARLRQGRFADGQRWLEDAVCEAQAAGADDVLAHAYYLLDWALTDLGRGDDAARYRTLALPIYERLGDLSGQANVLNNLGIDAYYEGRWDEAIELYERSRQARERSGDIVQLGLAANNIGEILSDQGRLGEAEALFLEALRVWRGSNFRIGDGVATSNLGRAAARAERYEEARRRYEEAAAIFDSIGATSFRVDVDAREAERRLFAGAADGALELADDVCARFERSGTATPAIISMTHRVAGGALAVLGLLEAALERLDRAEAIARQASAEFELALALHERGKILELLGDPTAEAHAIAAGALLDQLGVASTFSPRLVSVYAGGQRETV